MSVTPPLPSSPASAEPAGESQPVSGRLSGAQGWTKAARRYGIPHLRLRQIAELVRLSGTASVLDVGCSSGFLRTLLPGIDYRGVDFIAPSDSHAEFPFWQVDFNRDALPTELSGLEAVVCSGSLEYVADLPAFLKALSDRLRPGGVFVASYYNFNHIARRWAVLTGRTFWTHPDWRGFYSPADFTGLLAKAGLSVTRIVPHWHALGPSPRIEETVDLPTVLPPRRPWSFLLAHQLLFVARKG